MWRRHERWQSWCWRGSSSLACQKLTYILNIKRAKKLSKKIIDIAKTLGVRSFSIEISLNSFSRLFVCPDSLHMAKAALFPGLITSHSPFFVPLSLFSLLYFLLPVFLFIFTLTIPLSLFHSHLFCLEMSFSFISLCLFHFCL